jgi:hypothetical protein
MPRYKAHTNRGDNLEELNFERRERKERRGKMEKREATEATGVIDEGEDTCRDAGDSGNRFSYSKTIGYSNTIADSQQIVNR